MLNFNKLTPQCLRHNKNWVYFFKTVNVVWTDNVAKHIPNLSVASSIDLDTATREDILLRASRFGWTFADNFSANWEDDERAERFLKRFIESWIPYCRSYAGTLSLASYMGYLLGMEIRIVQLWSNAHDHWDTKPMHKLFRLEETQLPDDYLVTGNADYPFNPDLEFDATFPLRSRSDLDNQVAGWKTVDQDPENGWYPTSHFDVYVDLVQVPTSDLQEKTAEDIITSLFYELADMNQVLRAIVYSYSFNQVVKVSSALAIKERLQATDWGAPLEPDWSLFYIHPLVNINQRNAIYTGHKTNGIETVNSTATLNINTPMVNALSLAYYRTMEAITSIVNAIAQGNAVTWDVPNKKIMYDSNDLFAETISLSFENGEARDSVSNQVWGSFGATTEVVASSPLGTGGALHSWNFDSAIYSPNILLGESFRITFDFYYTNYSRGGYGQPLLNISEGNGQRVTLFQLFNNGISIRAYNSNLASDWNSVAQIVVNTKYTFDFQVIDGVATLHINEVNVPVYGTWTPRTVKLELGAPAAQDWNNTKDIYIDNFKVYGLAGANAQKSTTFQEIVDAVVQDAATDPDSLNWMKSIAGSHSNVVQDNRMVSATEIRELLEASVP